MMMDKEIAFIINKLRTSNQKNNLKKGEITVIF